MNDKLEDSHWVTAVIMIRVKEMEKGWDFIVFAFFFFFSVFFQFSDKTWNLTTDSQKEIGLVCYRSLHSMGVIPQTLILNDDLRRATKNNLEEVYRKESFESWTRKGAWK